MSFPLLDLFDMAVRYQGAVLSLVAALVRGVPSAGTPRRARPDSLREQLRRGGDYERFFAEYGRLLQARDEAVRRWVQLARTDSVCLMCFEHDYRRCHRHVLAEKLRAAGVDVTHL